MSDHSIAELLMIRLAVFLRGNKDAGHRGQFHPRHTALQSLLRGWLAGPGLLSVNVLKLLSLTLNVYK